MDFLVKSIFTFLFLFSSLLAVGQQESFIALGDLHNDRIEDHDPDFVISRPQDLKQIMNEYPAYTTFFMPKFLKLIKKQTLSYTPAVKAVVQLGDLVQRVAQGKLVLNYYNGLAETPLQQINLLDLQNGSIKK